MHPACIRTVPSEFFPVPSVPFGPAPSAAYFCSDSLRFEAEGQGFEPWNTFVLPVFKTGAIDHSATLPTSAFSDTSHVFCRLVTPYFTVVTMLRVVICPGSP